MGTSQVVRRCSTILNSMALIPKLGRERVAESEVGTCSGVELEKLSGVQERTAVLQVTSNPSCKSLRETLSCLWLVRGVEGSTRLPLLNFLLAGQCCLSPLIFEKPPCLLRLQHVYNKVSRWKFISPCHFQLNVSTGNVLNGENA